MKFYYQRPTKEIRTIKLDKDASEYEFWVLTPVRIGSARKVGTQQVIGENGERFANIQSAILHYAEKYDSSAAHSAEPRQPAAKVVQVPGMTIVARGKWSEFCQMRQLNLDAAELVAKSYTLTPDELHALGIAHEDMQ